MYRVILMLLLFPATCFSQNFIGKNKMEIIKAMPDQLQAYDSLANTFSDKDSLITFTTYAGTSRYTDFSYQFDRMGKCQIEKIKSGCESCFNDQLDKILEQKNFEWKQINGNQYVSKFSDQLLLEIQTDKNAFSLSILRTNWTRELYTMITGN